MIQTLLRSLSPRTVPPLCRVSYARELGTSATFPVAVSLTEGAVAGYIAAQVFSASQFQVAIITAAAMFTNLSSALWARATRGRRKVPSIAAMMAGTVACVAGVAFLPESPAGAWWLVGLIVLAHLLRVGMITVRSTIWRYNYPRSQRGKITGRLAFVVNLVLLVAPTVVSFFLELNHDLFRVLFAAASVIGFFGVIGFLRVRLRGEKLLLRFERSPGVEPVRHGEAVGIYEFTAHARDRSQGMWAILRRDPMFRRYMLWQFIAGVSNMMIEPVVVIIAVLEANRLDEGNFIVGMALTHTLPTLLAVLTLPYWGTRLDRMHVVKFRVEQSWLWTASQLLIWVAALWHTGPVWAVIGLMGLGRIILGVARGAGTLAWNLGHNDFASREMVSAYMGVHVTLTGIRGVFAPFLGVFLYSGITAFAAIPGVREGAIYFGLETFSGIGGHVFLVSAVLSLISVLGFWSMDAHLRRLGHNRPRED